MCVDPWLPRWQTFSCNCADHIEPHRGDAEKFWDLEGNCQALCFRCHQSKTARWLKECQHVTPYESNWGQGTYDNPDDS